MLIRRKIMQYNDMSKEELLALKESLNKEYAEAKAKGLALDMSRGKPSAKQLDVSLGLLDTINSSSDLKALDGTDCRNYGVLDGIPEAKKLMADMMGMLLCMETQVLILCMTRFREHTHMVFLVILHGASLIRLSSYVQFLDMTDILQSQKDLELR